MIEELTNAELAVRVAQNLKQHLLMPVRVGLGSNDASECRKQIIELIALPKPKNITLFLA